MNGITNEKVFGKEYDFIKPLLQKIKSLIDNSIRDCHDKYFHTFDHICEYDISFTNITNNESVNFTISDKSMASYELNKKLTIAHGNGFLFIQMNKLTIKIHSNLSNINICCFLKHRIPMCHRKSLLKISQNRDYIQTHCNERRNPFHFACRHWYSNNKV